MKRLLTIPLDLLVWLLMIVAIVVLSIAGAIGLVLASVVLNLIDVISRVVGRASPQ